MALCPAVGEWDGGAAPTRRAAFDVVRGVTCPGPRSGTPESPSETQSATAAHGRGQQTGPQENHWAPVQKRKRREPAAAQATGLPRAARCNCAGPNDQTDCRTPAAWRGDSSHCRLREGALLSRVGAGFWGLWWNGASLPRRQYWTNSSCFLPKTNVLPSARMR